MTKWYKSTDFWAKRTTKGSMVNNNGQKPEHCYVFISKVLQCFSTHRRGARMCWTFIWGKTIIKSSTWSPPPSLTSTRGLSFMSTAGRGPPHRLPSGSRQTAATCNLLTRFLCWCVNTNGSRRGSQTGKQPRKPTSRWRAGSIRCFGETGRA